MDFKMSNSSTIFGVVVAASVLMSCLLQHGKQNCSSWENKDVCAKCCVETNVFKQNLRKKTAQMKAMASELNMYQAQINDYRYELERTNRELMICKKKQRVSAVEKKASRIRSNVESHDSSLALQAGSGDNTNSWHRSIPRNWLSIGNFVRISSSGGDVNGFQKKERV